MTIEQRIQHQRELDRRHDELTRLATWNICAQCNGPLVVAWLYGNYELVCGQNHSHVGIKSWKEHPGHRDDTAGT